MSFIDENDDVMFLIMFVVFLQIYCEINNFLHDYHFSIQMFENYFDLNAFDDEYVKRTMRFIKFQIRLFTKYFDIVFIR